MRGFVTGSEGFSLERGWVGVGGWRGWGGGGGLAAGRGLSTGLESLGQGFNCIQTKHININNNKCLTIISLLPTLFQLSRLVGTLTSYFFFCFMPWGSWLDGGDMAGGPGAPGGRGAPGGGGGRWGTTARGRGWGWWRGRTASRGRGERVEVGVAHLQVGAELGEAGQSRQVEGAGEVAEEVEGARHPHRQRRRQVGEAWRWQPTRLS